jgi:hypothetical protein
MFNQKINIGLRTGLKKPFTGSGFTVQGYIKTPRFSVQGYGGCLETRNS